MPAHGTAVLDDLTQLGHVLVLALDGELLEALDTALVIHVRAIQQQYFLVPIEQRVITDGTVCIASLFGLGLYSFPKLVYLLLLCFFPILRRLHILLLFKGPFHKHATNIGVVAFEQLLGGFDIVAGICKKLFCIDPVLVHLI